MKKILIIFFLTLTAKALSQSSTDNNTVIPPSPTAASLGKFINNYGNSSTGAINTSIPIFDIQSGTINDNISLKYNSGGFKPAEIPGWVGAGWSLSVGGVITRISRGLPDDTYQYGYLSKLSDAQSLDNALKTGNGIPINNYLDAIDHNQFDYQPDLFAFHVGKYSGQFYIDFSGIIRIIPYQNISITYQRADNSEHNAIACIDSWTITTPEGNQYSFTDKEWSRTPTTVATQPYDIYSVSSWYLTNGTSLNGDFINYTYQGVHNQFSYHEYPSASIGVSHALQNTGGTGTAPYYYWGYYPTNNFSKNATWNEVIYLSQVDTKSTTVKFFSSERQDNFKETPLGGGIVLDDRQLDSIAIYSNVNLTTPVKSFSLKYSSPSYNSRNVPL